MGQLPFVPIVNNEFSLLLFLHLLESFRRDAGYYCLRVGGGEKLGCFIGSWKLGQGQGAGETGESRVNLRP